MHSRNRAFTLIELIVVIALVAILSVLVILSLYRVKQKARLSVLSDDLFTIAKSVNQYVDDHNYAYPPTASRGVVPTGLDAYLLGGVWPTGPWKLGQFEWDNLIYTYHAQVTPSGVPAAYQPYLGKKLYQASYHLCPLNDPNPTVNCVDPVLFPNFIPDSSIFYCLDGPCVPHQDEPEIVGYCVNCKVKQVNY